MPESIHPFPASVQDKLFKTERGDLCLCLHEAWPSLLIDLGLLGPVAVVSHSEQVALASFSVQLEFLPVPGGTEMVEVGSGICLETERLGCVIAGQEVETGKLSLHFFDRDGFGLFKVMPAPGSDRDGFIQFMEHYARDPELVHSQDPVLEPLLLGQGAVTAEEREHLRKAWTTFPAALGGNLVPGGQGVSWWDALRLAGPGRAKPINKEGLLKAILAAHHHEGLLRFSAWRGGLHQEIALVPRRLEKCGHCFHLLDVSREAHLFFESGFEAWVGFHGNHHTPAVHIFSRDGQRRGVIQFDEAVPENEAWKRLIFEANLPLPDLS